LYFLSNFLKTKSIRGLIVLIFVACTVFFTLVTGYLAYSSGLQAIMKNADQMAFAANTEIAKVLAGYLEEPYHLAQIHRNVILNKQLDFSNQAQRDNYFAETLDVFPRVTNAYVGLADGHEYGARREDDGGIVVWNSDLDRKTLDYYRYDRLAGRQGYLSSLFQYDTRQRPPYLRGLSVKQPAWTDIYASATGRGLVITAVYPIISPDNELMGVIGSSLLLHWIDEYLKTLQITPHTSIYILSKNGKVIASSDESVVKTQRSAGAPALVSASKSDNILLAQCVSALKGKGQSIETINNDVELSFSVNNTKFLLRAHPLSGVNNLEWLSLVLIPEKDLTYYLDDLRNQLILLAIIACILGLIAGVLTARYIINPIINMNHMAKKMADGDFSAKIETLRQDEIGQLIQTVNEMSSKLEQSFDKLSTFRLRIKLLTAGLETSSNLVVILQADRSIWWVNLSFEALSGYSSNELIGKDVRILLSERNDPERIRQAVECLSAQREWRGEIIAQDREGREFWDAISVTPIQDEIGVSSYFLIVGQDITEKVKAREEMSSAQDAKAKAEKLLSIGTMAAGISHEINQPLNSIKVISGGMVYLINQGEKLQTEEIAESVREISSQADRIAKIIKHLRSFIRRDEKKPVPCNLNTSIEMALGLVGEQLAGHSILAKKDLQLNLPPVAASPTGLEEIIVNLLVNAMQAFDAITQPNKEIVIRTYFSGQVILEIVDNGPGIAPALRNKIFETFVSTKPEGENMGLGLAIVKNLVESYGGTIELASSETPGARFIIRFPALQGEDKDKENFQ